MHGTARAGARPRGGAGRARARDRAETLTARELRAMGSALWKAALRPIMHATTTAAAITGLPIFVAG